MADASGGTTDLASLLRTNNVEALHATVHCAPGKYLVWTRLPEDNSSWIINASDGVDVWHLRLDQEQLDSHRELAEIDKYETYFARFRLEFESGAISISRLPNKVSLTVGTAIPSLNYDLYEAKASEKKTELQTILFRLADKVSVLTEQLKVSSDSLERVKNQKDGTASGSSIFDIPPKKTSQTLPVKRKQGHSLINPGSRKEAEVGSVVADGDNTKHNVHISVLGNDQTLDIYMCTDPACEHFCTKTNKRYHCPLCNNKPQKPGRMRRHFEKMHSGKQIVQHGGYQMLRCKLRCTKANGRITDNSHYHCCLCGRVLVRKVHLYCHLQAHAVGSMQEIDEMLDTKDDTEEGPLGDTEMEDDDDNDTSLDTQQITGLESSEQDNVVALSDGTQVVFVQSIQDSETLTVVPLDEQLAQHGSHSDGSGTVVPTSTDLSTGLAALPSVSSSLDSVQQHLPQELTVKQVEAMLNKGEENSQDTSMTAEPCQGNLRNLSDEDEALQTFTPQEPSEIEIEPGANEAQSSIPKQTQVEAMEFEPCLQVANLQMSAASSISDTNMADVPDVEQNNLQLGQVTQASDVLTSQNVDLNATTTVTDQGSSKLIMVNPMSKPLFDEETSSSQNRTPKTKAVRQDSLLLVDATSSPKGDDQVFKVLLNNLSSASSCFNHPSVLNEKDNLDIHRCKNTFCDCRLYHCPLCTCLPNKPGRIREHFKKIHAEDLVIRYRESQQMLRCKLGCSRPSGTKVFNSHYHCCICGAICIRKSGVYEHMRINHSSQPVKKDGNSHLSQEHKETRLEAVPKQVVMQVPTAPSETLLPGAQVAQPQTPQGQGVVTSSTTPQAFTVQLQQQGGNDGQSHQQLVILVPQHTNQTQVQSTVQAQQPIVIVMPQTGGTQMTQPIVVPLPQVSNK